MTSTCISIQERLQDLIKDTDEPQCLVELLQFFGRHPHTRFSRRAIVGGLSSRSEQAEKALKYFLSVGMAREYAGNNISFYSLTTEDRGWRNLALYVAKINRHFSTWIPASVSR